VNVVVSRGAGMVDRQKQLSPQSVWIDSPETTDGATHIDLCDLIKRRCLAPKLRIARTQAIKRAKAFPANKEITIGVHVECPRGRLVRNIDRWLPGHASVGGALEFHNAAVIAVSAVVGLVLKTVAGTVRLVDRKPLLIAATSESVGLELCPGLATVG